MYLLSFDWIRFTIRSVGEKKKRRRKKRRKRTVSNWRGWPEPFAKDRFESSGAIRKITARRRIPARADLCCPASWFTTTVQKSNWSDFDDGTALITARGTRPSFISFNGKLFQLETLYGPSNYIYIYKVESLPFFSLSFK